MSRRADRWAKQQALEREWARDPRLERSRSLVEVPRDEQCPAALGRRCSFTMRGNDGVYRCWYCCKTKAQAAAERAQS